MDRQPLEPGFVGEGPADRVGDGEDPASARPQDTAHLAHHPHRVGDEGQRPVGGAGQVEGAVGEGQGAGVGLDEGERRRAGDVPGEAQRVPELPVRDVQGHRAGPAGRQPARALGRSGADLQHGPSGQLLRRAQQAGPLLVQPLGPPHEAGVAEEVPVLALVVVRVAVPPQAAGPDALGVAGLAARDFWFALLVHAARRRNLRSEVAAGASSGAGGVPGLVGKHEGGPGKTLPGGDIRLV